MIPNRIPDSNAWRRRSVSQSLPRDSGLEGTRLSDCRRRLLQTGGQALRTRANSAQVIERVDTCGVAIAPAEAEGIIPYRPYRHSFNSRRDVAMSYPAHTGKLIDARCAGTVFTQVPRWIGGEMAVVPGDVRPGRADPLYQRWHQIRQRFAPSIGHLLIPFQPASCHGPRRCSPLIGPPEAT